MQQNKPQSHQTQHPSLNSQQQQKVHTFEYYEPTHQAYQYKIFINECNGYIGSQLVQIFRNDDQIQVNPNIICGTENKSIKTIGNLQIDNLIDVENKTLLNSIWKKSDIILFSLDNSNAKQFEYMIKYLRKTKNQSQKPQKIICISSLLTWNSKRVHSHVKPSLDNLPNRNSTQNNLMQLQNLCLDINNLNIGIQSYIVCSGLIYGYGQNILFKYFKQALQQNQSLKIYGTGTNIIPMIHLQDLCYIVKQLAIKGYVNNDKRQRIVLPKSRYYFAVDNIKITQHQLIKCIASSLGNGNIQQIPIQNVFLADNFNQMTINLQVKQHDITILQKWHSKQGFIKNIQKIISQFNIYRGLKPNKIIILGPPASGKSKIAQNLQQAYGLPILTVKKVLDQLLLQHNQFANQIRHKLQQIKTQKVQEQRKIYEEAKKKKKGKKDANDQFDPSKIIPRLPQQYMIKVFKNRLKKSDCLNKGYILDGWPKLLKSCQVLFTNQKGQIDQLLLPNTCFVINASQEEIKERIKTLPQNIKDTTHWNQQGTVRRLQTYTKGNQEGLTVSFFKGKVDIKQIPFNYEGGKQFVQFVQRNGPLGFKKKQNKVVEQEKQHKEENKADQINKNQNDENQQEQNQENQDKFEEPSNQQFDLQKLTEHQKQILNEKSRPIRQYLIDNVIPEITQGLLQICKQSPNDPIDFLIKFLEKKEASKKKKK